MRAEMQHQTFSQQVQRKVLLSTVDDEILDLIERGFLATAEEARGT